MLTAEQNRLLTEVEGDAPMGQFMRERHWIPCARSESLEPGGAPKHVRLLGSDYVAFRVACVSAWWQRQREAGPLPHAKPAV